MFSIEFNFKFNLNSQISSTTNHHNQYLKLSSPAIDNNTGPVPSPTKSSTITIFPNVKYKNNIMEKYLRGLDCSNNNNNNKRDGMELSKWLESAANFTPKKNNYIEWDPVARYSDSFDLKASKC